MMPSPLSTNPLPTPRVERWAALWLAHVVGLVEEAGFPVSARTGTFRAVWRTHRSRCRSSTGRTGRARCAATRQALEQ